MKTRTHTCLLTLLLCLLPATGFSSTLETIKERGKLHCGVGDQLTGFATRDENGHWQGLDVDFCRALAAATLGDHTRVAFTPLSTRERFTALQSGELDLLSRNTTWTLSRDTALGLSFPGIIYFDNQGFMAKRKIQITDPAQLNDKAVCVKPGTTTQLNLKDYFAAHQMTYEPILVENFSAMISQFDEGKCDIVSSDLAQLHGMQRQLKDPASSHILDMTIAREPLGPVVREGDDQWFDIVRWTLFALINAEALGITRDNVDTHLESPDPRIRRLLGQEGQEAAKSLGLAGDWAYQIVSQVGNYAEIFDRHIGMNSALKLERDQNHLWKNNGILYAPPFR